MARQTKTISEKAIEFMALHGMSKTVLGQKALNDPHAVIDLLAGRRRMWPETAQKLEKFMATYRSGAAA